MLFPIKRYVSYELSHVQSTKHSKKLEKCSSQLIHAILLVIFFGAAAVVPECSKIREKTFNFGYWRIRVLLETRISDWFLDLNWRQIEQGFSSFLAKILVQKWKTKSLLNLSLILCLKRFQVLLPFSGMINRNPSLI